MGISLWLNLHLALNFLMLSFYVHPDHFALVDMNFLLLWLEGILVGHLGALARGVEKVRVILPSLEVREREAFHFTPGSQ